MENDYQLKDSGARQQFDTGAVRDIQTGKGRFDLLPSRALSRLAKHFEKGAVKYGDNNYLKGIPLRRYMDSCLRHLFAYAQGANDEDHLVAATWNLVAMLETETRLREGLLPGDLCNLGPYEGKVTKDGTEPDAGKV